MQRWISNLFGRAERKPSPVRGAQPARSEEAMAPKALAIVYNPAIGQGKGLLQVKGWNNVDALIHGYIADIEECSGGLVRYQVVDRQTVDHFPVKQDGFQYTAKMYAEVTSGRAKAHDPDTVDYHHIVDEFHLLERVASGEIDEVWLFGFPFAGFYESRMAGAGAFWCNAPPLEETSECPRRFIMMGFSYERGVGEMLEDLGHRTESIMTRVYQGRPDRVNLWKHYTLYDKVAPGRAEIGSVHYAPNSERDYDWGNRRYVTSNCDDWLNFPNFTGERRRVNCADWGNGDIRLHHQWWLSHLPKVQGETDGVDNNWWRYVIKVDDPFFDR